MATLSHGGVNLVAIARGMMQERGFLVDFPREALAEAERATEPTFERLGIKDLSGWLWSSMSLTFTSAPPLRETAP